MEKDEYERLLKMNILNEERERIASELKDIAQVMMDQGNSPIDGWVASKLVRIAFLIQEGKDLTKQPW